MKVSQAALAMAVLLAIPVPRARGRRSLAVPADVAKPQEKTTAPTSQIPKPAASQRQGAPITVTTGLVHLVAIVTDRHNAFVTDLSQSDFKVLEDGVPQEIQFFGRETDLPLRVGLLLDTSNSIRPRLQFEQDAAIDFLSTVLRRTKDMAFLMTFDNEPEIIQDYTSEISDLTDVIRKQRAGGGTALRDAIYMASEKLINAPLPKPPESSDVRRVLVVISDGNDNLSDHALSDAIEESLRAETSIYSISTNTDWLTVDDESKPKKYEMVGGDKVLQEFAAQTGGRAFFPYRIDDLAQSFTDIGAELRSQYFIAYSSTNKEMNGQYRQIQVETNRKGLNVRARKGYYAIPPRAVPDK